jgi:hypothetical protein
MSLILTHRHPELVSGSIYQPITTVRVAGWMLKQVQHDVAYVCGGLS